MVEVVENKKSVCLLCIYIPIRLTPNLLSKESNFAAQLPQYEPIGQSSPPFQSLEILEVQWPEEWNWGSKNVGACFFRNLPGKSLKIARNLFFSQGVGMILSKSRCETDEATICLRCSHLTKFNYRLWQLSRGWGNCLKKKLAMRRKLLSGVIALRHTIDVTVLNWWMKTVMLIQYTCLWLTNPCIEARSSYKRLPGCSCRVRSMDAMWFPSDCCNDNSQLADIRIKWYKTHWLLWLWESLSLNLQRYLLI